MNTEEKVIEVAKRISESRSIDDLRLHNGEYYFKFKGHTFSITEVEGDNSYSFFVYPRWDLDTASLVAEFEYNMPNDIKYVAFNSGDISKESRQVFESLYRSLSAREVGVDDVLDDILDDLSF